MTPQSCPFCSPGPSTSWVSKGLMCLLSQGPRAPITFLPAVPYLLPFPTLFRSSFTPANLKEMIISLLLSDRFRGASPALQRCPSVNSKVVFMTFWRSRKRVVSQYTEGNWGPTVYEGQVSGTHSKCLGFEGDFLSIIRKEVGFGS